MNKFLLIVFAAIFLSGCSKNNNPSPKAPVTIVDRWLITGDTSNQLIDGVVNSTYVLAGINSPYYQFNADGTGTVKNNISEPDQILKFTYIVSDNKITFTFPIQEALPLYSYQASATIQKLTAHTMVILFDEAEPGNTHYEFKENVNMSR